MKFFILQSTKIKQVLKEKEGLQTKNEELASDDS